jgi:hypothetical protein
MESDKPKGKRGRPRKIVTETQTTISSVKRKRGRPSKSPVDGENNIKIKKVAVEQPVIEDAYVPPTILRRKRVFNFDKRVFHMFSAKYNGDIVIMGYVFDILMKMYMDKKITLPVIDEKYYSEWCKGTLVIEPLEEKEISTSHAMMRGIPIQYKYPMVIDKDLYNEFEKKCNRYSQYITNELVKMLLDEKNKINIDISKYKEWCTI